MSAIVPNWVWIYRVIGALMSPPAWFLWIALLASLWYHWFSREDETGK